VHLAEYLFVMFHLFVGDGVVSLLSVDHNHIHTCHSYTSRIIKSVLNELLFHSDFEFPVFLLKLYYDIFHILFDLVLFFYFETVGSFHS